MTRAAILLIACLAVPAPAQSPPTATATPPAPSPAPATPPAPAARHDTNQPVDINSDRLEVQDRADRAVFAGSVRAVQGDMTLTSQRLTVAYTRGPPAAPGQPASSPQINRLDATGGVVVRTPTETATGNVAIYDLDRKLITMLGNVSLLRQGNRVNGGRLVLDLTTNRATVDGSAVAGGTGVATGRGGRVSGHFTVPQRSN